MLRLGLPVAFVVALLDQLSKWWVVGLFRPDGVTETPFYSPVRITLAPVFDLVMTWNRGVSFGIFNHESGWNSLVLSALSLAIAAGLAVWLARVNSRMLALALGLVIGGAVGNVIDRIRFGAVADFLDLHVGLWHWPAFNLADSSITVGAIIIVLDSLFAPRTSSKN
jgi:signal peptidase II